MRPLFAVQKLDEEPRVSRMIGQPSLKPNRFGEADDKPKRVARRLRRAVLRLIRRPRRNIRVADTFGRWRFAGVSPAVARVGEFPLPHDVGGEVVKLRAKEYRPLAVVDNFVPVDCQPAQTAGPRINLDRAGRDAETVSYTHLR